MTVTPEELRDTMRLWTSGVGIVATADSTRRAGVTVSSFTSVSLNPPLVLVCLQKGIYPLQLIHETQCFAISLLRAGQADISTQFAGFVPLPEGEDKFYGIKITTAITGAPILAEALAWMDCRVQAIHEAGGSEIVVGEVVATERQAGVMPLAYHNRSYFTLHPQG